MFFLLYFFLILIEQSTFLESMNFSLITKRNAAMQENKRKKSWRNRFIVSDEYFFSLKHLFSRAKPKNTKFWKLHNLDGENLVKSAIYFESFLFYIWLIGKRKNSLNLSVITHTQIIQVGIPFLFFAVNITVV